MRKYRIFIATYPFGKVNQKPIELLKSTGWDVTFNLFERRLKTGEVEKYIQDADAVIAGTEPYNEQILAWNPQYDFYYGIEEIYNKYYKKIKPDTL